MFYFFMFEEVLVADYGVFVIVVGLLLGGFISCFVMLLLLLLVIWLVLYLILILILLHLDTGSHLLFFNSYRHWKHLLQRFFHFLHNLMHNFFRLTMQNRRNLNHLFLLLFLRLFSCCLHNSLLLLISKLFLEFPQCLFLYF